MLRGMPDRQGVQGGDVHAVLVANPRKLKLIYGDNDKDDRLDAERLARVGRLDPSLLSPVTHRKRNTQADLEMLRLERF